MQIILPEFLRWQPGAEQWAIPVSAWGRGPDRYLRLRRAWLDGRPVDRYNIIFPPVLPVYLLPAGVGTGAERVAAPVRSPHPAGKAGTGAVDNSGTGAGATDPAVFLRNLAAGDKRYPCSWLFIKAAGLPALQAAGGGSSLELEFVTFGGLVYRAATAILVAPLPVHPRWQPVELQMHNSWHDDGHWVPRQIAGLLAGQGYQALYFTPHADLIAGHWREFTSFCRELPGPMAVFPGLEIATRNDQGHLLVYGLADQDGLSNSTFPGQEIIDLADRLPGFNASVTISHPFGRPPWPWETEPVVDYSGLEVFSGLQSHFELQARPLELWRAEVTRLAGRVAQTGFFPSARAGSDWHQILPYPGYVTYVYLPEGWTRLPWEVKKYLLDLVLRQGYTIASHHGGLGYFLINGQPPGSLINLPPGAVMEIEITWQGVVAGKHHLFLFQGNNSKNPIWQAEAAGTSKRHTWTLELSAPGKLAYYWLYVAGLDQVLTSPVFIRP